VVGLRPILTPQTLWLDRHELKPASTAEPPRARPGRSRSALALPGEGQTIRRRELVVERIGATLPFAPVTVTSATQTSTDDSGR